MMPANATRETAATAFSIRWLHDLSALEAGSGLAQLQNNVPAATLFTTEGWLGCAAAALPPERTLHILCAFSGENLLACLPLTRGRETIHNLPVISLRFLGDPFADRIALLVDPRHEEILPSLFDALLHSPFAWDLLLLSELVPDNRLREALGKWSAARQIPVHWQHCSRTPILPLSCRDVEELRTAYSRSLATRLRRSRKKLAAAGRSEFRRLLPDPAETAVLLPRLKELEDASWKGAERIGIFSTPRHFAFFRRLAMVLAVKKQLDIGLLLHEGRLISYRFGFRFRNVFLDYNLAFHPDFAAMSPGRILLEEMIASSVEIGLQAVDASRSGIFHAHQLQDWTRERIDHFQVWIFNRTLRGRTLNVLHTRIRPALKKIVEY